MKHRSAMRSGHKSDDGSDNDIGNDNLIDLGEGGKSKSTKNSKYRKYENEVKEKKKKDGKVKIHRQRMPFQGGYGGMFVDPRYEVPNHPGGNLRNEKQNAINSNGDGNTAVSGSSSVTSAFSLASRFFAGSTRHRYGRLSRGGARENAYLNMKRKESDIDSVSESSSRVLPKCLRSVFKCYLHLPFRFRYFLQLFSVIGVFMLASLNYFIAFEKGPKRSKASSSNSILQTLREDDIMEGGGASPNQIPRLRVRSPFDLLHQDFHANELFHQATAKLRVSSRFDPNALDGQLKGGPFAFGWKSMPRQIFNDFPTGLSDDSRTIGHFNQGKKKPQFGSKVANALDILTGRDDGSMNPLHQTRNGEELGAKLPAKGTVAYVLPVTSCYPPSSSFDPSSKDNNSRPYSPNQPKDEATFRDFAVMLRAMIHAHSYRNPASGSMYDYKMHSIIHPSAKRCQDRGSGDGGKSDSVDRSVLLQNLGYHVSIKGSPVDTNKIEGSEYLQKYFSKYDINGDSGHPSADLIRLHAYELEEYDAVVLVDYDTLVLGSADEVYDLITDKSSTENGGNSIDAVFSWEHVPSLINPIAKASVVNLSFLVIRPSKATFRNLISTYQSSPFAAGKGWGMIGRGSFPGWMTSQGFLTFYYDEVANGSKVEMNRCYFGNTGEKYPTKLTLFTNGGKLECASSAGASSNQCNDCNHAKLEDVYVADLSYCLAPWECGGDDALFTSDSALSSGLCRKFHKQWFGGRLQMEDVHPQIQKGSGILCVDGKYQPMLVAQHESLV